MRCMVHLVLFKMWNHVSFKFILNFKKIKTDFLQLLWNYYGGEVGVAMDWIFQNPI